MADGVGLGRIRLDWASDWSDEERTAPSRSAPTREVYRDSLVRVVSDEALSKADAKRLAKNVEKAWAYDARNLKWDDTRPLERPLTVAVLSRGAFTRFTGDASGSIAGVTTGPDLFVVPDRVARRPGPDDLDTVAHELVHVQDFREAGRRADAIPTYLVEGKAYVLGDRYVGRRTAHIDNVAAVLGQLSARDAAAVLQNFRHASDEQRNARFVFLGEVTGALFVEFLRTRVDGRGRADTLDRLSNATAAVGQGESYAAAFRREFGLSLPAAEQQFLRYLAETEGRPRARLAGTLYAV
jgi:hypothetical protein